MTMDSVYMHVHKCVCAAGGEGLKLKKNREEREWDTQEELKHKHGMKEGIRQEITFIET